MLNPFVYALRVFLLVVIGTGIVGNLVSCVIFRRPVFKKNSISTYGPALAISNLYTLTTFIYYFYTIYYNTQYDLANQSNGACKMFSYFNIALSAVSGWILVAFSIDKLISMRPSRFTIIKKKSFQLTVVVAIFLYNLLVNIEIPILFELEVENNASSICSFSTNNLDGIFTAIIALNLTFAPFGLMMITSLLIIGRLRTSRKKLESIDMANIDQQKRTRELKFAVSSLVLNVFFIVCRLPLVLSFLLNDYLSDDVEMFYPEISNLLYYGNSSATLLIHFVSNSIFRTEVIKLFKQKS